MAKPKSSCYTLSYLSKTSTPSSQILCVSNWKFHPFHLVWAPNRSTLFFSLLLPWHLTISQKIVIFTFQIYPHSVCFLLYLLWPQSKPTFLLLGLLKSLPNSCQAAARYSFKILSCSRPSNGFYSRVLRLWTPTPGLRKILSCDWVLRLCCMFCRLFPER